MTTPIREQYLRIKGEHPDAILLFRLGDFYETFDDDAHIAARELEITLTSKPLGKNLRVPLAGIPVQALQSYVSRLVARGYRVAICEQLEDPATSRGLVDRGVVRVITPGTAIDPGMLAPGDSLVLSATWIWRGQAGLANCDLSTGQIEVTSCGGDVLLDELGRLAPREVLIPAGDTSGLAALVGAVAVARPDFQFDPDRSQRLLHDYFGVASLEAFGIEADPAAIGAAGALLAYLQETQRGSLGRLNGLRRYTTARHMQLDAQTRRNLELTSGARGGSAGSLVAELDRTNTASGARLLRRWLNEPLLERPEIETRLAAVARLVEDGLLRRRLADELKGVADVPRIAGRLRSRTATPRDLVALARSLRRAATVGREAGTVFAGLGAGTPDPCDDVAGLIDAALVDDPKAEVGDGGVFRPGFSDELDGIGVAAASARSFIAGLEQTERERSGIKSLKVGYNRVFGYYLEISNVHRDQAPADYIRKQTLVGAERYITPELKEYEAIVLNASDRLEEVAAGLYRRLLDQLDGVRGRIEALGEWLATVDVIVALADAAVVHRLVRPLLADDACLEVRGGRHLVVEASLPPGGFVPNDVALGDGRSIMLLTGPNMAGKSTYLRQVALICLLAQAGSFVPAESARIGLTDRIFTRIGAQDDIASGQSTFMVEMVETARILRHATPRSLLILDEIGRGTSTWDGLAIAQALVEYLHNHPDLRCRTLFATHYHELTSLADRLPGVFNATMAVADAADGVVFLRQVVAGRADRSYGVHVAALAGLPRGVLTRAAEVLASLESTATPALAPPSVAGAPGQLSLFPVAPVVEALASLDVEALTPLEAINRLYALRQQARDGT